MNTVVYMPITEAIPFIKERVNMSYITSSLNKSVSWFHSKCTDVAVDYRFGFNQKDCEQLNAVLKSIANTCMEHILEPPSVSTSNIVYSMYVASTIKELRKCISMKYLRENYTTIGRASWCNKLALRKTGKCINYFSAKNVEEINNGIISTANFLLSIKIVL